jgi:hypothetical protein
MRGKSALPSCEKIFFQHTTPFPESESVKHFHGSVICAIDSSHRKPPRSHFCNDSMQIAKPETYGTT